MYKPKGIGVPTPGHAKISFEKLGVEAMAVYSHPTGDPATWVKIGMINHSPFVDGKALANGPEKRQYKLRGVINGQEIGEWSEIIDVTVSE